MSRSSAAVPCGRPHPRETYRAFADDQIGASIGHPRSPHAPVVCGRLAGHKGDHDGYGAGMRRVFWS